MKIQYDGIKNILFKGVKKDNTYYCIIMCYVVNLFIKLKYDDKEMDLYYDITFVLEDGHELTYSMKQIDLIKDVSRETKKENEI